MSRNEPDDPDLVGRARRGDREAFTQLVMQYQVPLYNMALRMVGTPDDAADVAQEAFLRAWEKIRTLRKAPFKPWLFQIAVNLCYDHFRRGRRYGTMPDEEQGGKVENGSTLTGSFCSSKSFIRSSNPYLESGGTNWRIRRLTA